MESKWRFGTQAVHAGQRPDPETGAVMTPIFQTSTYAQSQPGIHRGYEYSRVSNPTRTALERNLAALENATHGVAFASGVAAGDAILRCLSRGDHVLCSRDLYGGNYRLIRQVHGESLQSAFVDLRDSEDVHNNIQPNTRLVWLESPGNPLLQVVDIKAVATIAKEYGAYTVVDNTFATPYLQQPLDLGADLVLHSTTKYIGGHSDVIGGAVCTISDRWAEELRFQVKATGSVPGPMDCYLLLRGCKTLHLRMPRHSENAAHLAIFLSRHPKVAHVYYPGLGSHAGHDIATRQMRHYGGMLSFTLLDDSIEAATQVLSSTNLFILAESLGGVESLIAHPATMTHASIPRRERIAMGLKDSLIRLSVGVEDLRDLEEDLRQAIK